MSVIKAFDIDLSDLPATGERRDFTITTNGGGEFRLEVKDLDTGKYYNFVEKSFETGMSFLQDTIKNTNYSSSIMFPAVTGGDDQYDIFLHAVPSSNPNESTTHVGYNEVRFGDGSLDINNSTGSNSLTVQKVIYQYAALALTLVGYSPTGTVTGTLGTDTVSINRGKTQVKTAFSFISTAAATSAYRVLRQPISSDVISFLQPVIGAAPIALPGENTYPTVTATGKINVAVSSSTNVTIDGLSATPKIGDKFEIIDGPNSSSPQIVVGVGGGYITSSVAISADNDKSIQFRNQMNFSWPIDNFAHLLKEGMIVVPATNVTASTSVGTYEDSITIFPGTPTQQTIIKNTKEPLSTLAKKPTIVNGLITVQEGQIVFDKQQELLLAGDTLNVGGYGENEVLRVYGWEVKFTDLTIALTAPSTTTTEATTAHATIAVSDVEGVINNVSRVGGIGIDPVLQNPLITSGGGADGAGDWVMDAVQTLENGATLTIENTGRIATITGKIEIVKAGTASQTLRFDIEELLSTSAP